MPTLASCSFNKKWLILIIFGKQYQHTFNNMFLFNFTLSWHSGHLYAFDQWCLRRIVHILYTAHFTNEAAKRRTGQPPVTSVIAKRRLRLFGHLARADPSQDHSRILRAAINHPPEDWLRTIELNLQPHNLGLNIVYRVQDCSKWCQLVETAMLTDGHATRWWWWWLNFTALHFYLLHLLF